MIAPHGPLLPLAAREHLEIRPWRAGLDQLVLLVRLAAMFALAGLDHVDLTSAGIERTGVLAAHAEQDDLGDIPEIEADAASVRPAVLPHLVPDQVGLVLEPPGLHHPQSVGQKGIGHPKIKMSSVSCEAFDGQAADIVQRHGLIA